MAHYRIGAKLYLSYEYAATTVVLDNLEAKMAASWPLTLF